MSDNGNKGAKEVKTIKEGYRNPFIMTQGTSNPADMLVNAGEDPLDIAMRSCLEDDILAVSMAAEWADLEEFEYESGKDGLLFNLAARTSVKGLAREQLVKAIIGDKEFRINRAKGIFDKVRDYAFSGDGDKEAAK